MRTLWFSAPSDDSDKKQSLEKDFSLVQQNFGVGQENHIVFNLIRKISAAQSQNDRISRGESFTKEGDPVSGVLDQTTLFNLPTASQKPSNKQDEDQANTASYLEKMSKSKKSMFSKKTKDLETEGLIKFNHFHSKANKILTSKKFMKGFKLGIALVVILQAMIVFQLALEFGTYFVSFLYYERINLNLPGPSSCCSSLRGQIAYVDALDLVLLNRKNIVPTTPAKSIVNRTLLEVAETARKYYRKRNFRFYNLKVYSILSMDQKEFAIERKNLLVDFFKTDGRSGGTTYSLERVTLQVGLLDLEGRLRTQLDMSQNKSTWKEGDLGVFDTIQANLRKNMYGHLGEQAFNMLLNSDGQLEYLSKAHFKYTILTQIFSIMGNLITLSISALVFIYWKFQMDKINFLLFSLKVVSVDRSKNRTRRSSQSWLRQGVSRQTIWFFFPRTT